MILAIGPSFGVITVWNAPDVIKAPVQSMSGQRSDANVRSSGADSSIRASSHRQSGGGQASVRCSRSGVRRRSGPHSVGERAATKIESAGVVGDLDIAVG
ncbi:hypothetical protein GCM10028864_53840 [Microlunatus parietis]